MAESLTIICQMNILYFLLIFSNKAVMQAGYMKHWNKRTEEEQSIAYEECRVSKARLRTSQSHYQSEPTRETVRLAMRHR